MVSKESVETRKIASVWMGMISFLKMLIDYKFPNSDEFDGSQWGEWKARIDKGHEGDEQNVDNWLELIDKGNQQYADQMKDVAGDELAEATALTDNMYAALVVSIWSQLEGMLNVVIRINDQAKSTQKKTLIQTINFCEDTLKGNQTGNSTFASCAKNLKQIQNDNLFSFDEIKITIKKKTKINIEECKAFAVINAIRILNNSFKHSGGYYRPDRKAKNQIDASLVSKWKIPSVEDKRKVDYYELPIKEVIADCRKFIDDLTDKLDDHLRSSKEVPSNAK